MANEFSSRVTSTPTGQSAFASIESQKASPAKIASPSRGSRFLNTLKALGSFAAAPLMFLGGILRTPFSPLAKAGFSLFTGKRIEDWKIKNAADEYKGVGGHFRLAGSEYSDEIKASAKGIINNPKKAIKEGIKRMSREGSNPTGKTASVPVIEDSKPPAEKESIGTTVNSPSTGTVYSPESSQGFDNSSQDIKTKAAMKNEDISSCRQELTGIKKESKNYDSEMKTVALRLRNLLSKTLYTITPQQKEELTKLIDSIDFEAVKRGNPEAAANWSPEILKARLDTIQMGEGSVAEPSPSTQPTPAPAAPVPQSSITASTNAATPQSLSESQLQQGIEDSTKSSDKKISQEEKMMQEEMKEGIQDLNVALSTLETITQNKSIAEKISEFEDQLKRLKEHAEPLLKNTEKWKKIFIPENGINSIIKQINDVLDNKADELDDNQKKNLKNYLMQFERILREAAKYNQNTTPPTTP